MEYLIQYQKDLIVIATATVTIFSALANIVPKDNIFGKIIHFVALNFKVK